MNARTKPDFSVSSRKNRSAQDGLQQLLQQHTARPTDDTSSFVTHKPGHDEGNPVIKHLDDLQGQLSEQLDSLNTVVASMQRISAIMDRMAKKNCTLNSGAALVDPARKKA